MRRIRPSTEDEMVYEFLKMEIDSERFKEQIEAVLGDMSVSMDIIVSGNIVCEKENALRAEILRRFRGYRDEELFSGFPEKIGWMWAACDKEDISKVKYMEYSYWNELSDYTGSPLEAANTIISGKTIYGVPNAGFTAGARKLEEGHKFPPMIFLTDEGESRYIILEGHARMTSYGLVPDLFRDVPVLLGYCTRESLDGWYGEMPERPA